MDAPSDIDINAAVRRVLVRHWIDLGSVQVRTCRGVTTLGGKLERLPQSAPALNADALELIQREVGLIRGVRRVHLKLENWSKRAEIWQPTSI